MHYTAVSPAKLLRYPPSQAPIRVLDREFHRAEGPFSRGPVFGDVTPELRRAVAKRSVAEDLEARTQGWVMLNGG